MSAWCAPSYDLKNLPQPDNKNQAQGFILSVLNNVAYRLAHRQSQANKRSPTCMPNTASARTRTKASGLTGRRFRDLSHAEYHFKSAFAASQGLGSAA
ncbi:Uncharacterised protein [Serratia fonticola]|uniref:Uncharacterized protein n=1 Tax=Serratia fonticola TaxID=47917 RepID=A0A4U9TM26_SERFO|nr:Uncharacterised protein [Serratia fonticola]